MKEYCEYELEVRAAVGDLLLTQLARRPELAEAIFNKLVRQFSGRNYQHKLLTNLTICAVDKELMEAPGEKLKIMPNRRRPATFEDILAMIDEGVKLRAA